MQLEKRVMNESMKNSNSYEQACAVMPGGVNTSLRNIVPHLVFAEAQGGYLRDVEGKKYIDYHAAFGAIILGHGYGKVSARVCETLEKLDLVGVGTTEPEIALARKIVEHVPSIQKVLLCNTGSEATYQAIRLARAVTGRKKIIKFQGCYHGWHDYVCRNILSPPEKIGARDPASAGMLDEAVDHTIVCTFNDLENVETTLKRHRGEIAALILEPIPHNLGCVLPKPGFLEGLRSLTRDHGVILIFDEVITGFRHHLGGYQAICGVLPDLTTLGKAMANGYPIAALGGRADLMDRFNTRPGGDVFFAGTYNGHTLGCAAALATIDSLENDGVHDHIFALGEKVRCGLQEIIDRLKIRGTAAGYGSVFLTYFQEPPLQSYSDLLRNDKDLFIRYRQKLLERGILKIPLNLKRNHVSFSHTEADIQRTLQVAEDSLKDLVCQRTAIQSV